MTEKIITTIFLFIQTLIAFAGYGGIVILMGIESACIPLPSELIMPFAGYLVYEGTMKLFWVATAGAVGCNVGSLIAYEIGCYGGRPLVERYGRWILMGRRELDCRPLLHPLGISGGFHRAAAASDPDVYCAARRYRPHAARSFPRVHISG